MVIVSPADLLAINKIAAWAANSIGSLCERFGQRLHQTVERLDDIGKRSDECKEAMGNCAVARQK